MRDFSRTADDEHERLQKLRALLTWAAANRAAHANAAVIVFGSVVRGDYWRGRSDIDLMVFAPTQAQVDGAHAALQLLIPGQHWAVTNAALNVFLQEAPANRSLAAGSPINFGLHGFDTLGNHIALMGDSPFANLIVPEGQDLVRLGLERLRLLVTPGQPVFNHTPSEKAIEAIKASTITMCARLGIAPTRHKDHVPTLFERVVPPFAEKGLWPWAWNDYRSGQRTLTDAALLGFVNGVVAAVGA